jgi:hypothetical protein
VKTWFAVADKQVARLEGRAAAGQLRLLSEGPDGTEVLPLWQQAVGKDSTHHSSPLLPVLVRNVSDLDDGAPMDVPMCGEDGRLCVVD